MKNTFLFGLIVASLNLHAQRIRAFVGIAGYLDTDFNGSVFGSATTGLEFKVINNVRPQIELGIMYGEPEISKDYTENGALKSVYRGKATAVNYSICPKIYLGDPDDDTCLIILPKYTNSKIFGRSNLVTRNPNDLSKPNEENKSASITQHSLGIGIGFSVPFSEKYDHSSEFILYFNGVNLGGALNTINPDRVIFSKDTFGLGLSVFFGGKRKI